MIEWKSFLYKWPKKIANDLTDNPLNFLNNREKKIVRERIWKDREKQTLEEIAKKISLTRERVRQIENSAYKKIKQQFRRELRETTKYLKQQVEKLGGVANFEELDVDLMGVSSQEQVIISSLFSLVSCQHKNIG